QPPDIGLSARGARMAGMNVRTLAISVAASPDEVFEFLANVQNLPLWATGYCLALREEGGRWMASTPAGEESVFIDSNRAGGCIDIYSGASPEEMSNLPIRILETDTGETVALFVLLGCGCCEEAYRGLVEEARGLIDRFGGGELSGCEAAALQPAEAY